MDQTLILGLGQAVILAPVAVLVQVMILVQAATLVQVAVLVILVQAATLVQVVVLVILVQAAIPIQALVIQHYRQRVVQKQIPELARMLIRIPTQEILLVTPRRIQRVPIRVQAPTLELVVVPTQEIPHAMSPQTRPVLIRGQTLIPEPAVTPIQALVIQRYHQPVVQKQIPELVRMLIRTPILEPGVIQVRAVTRAQLQEPARRLPTAQLHSPESLVALVSWDLFSLILQALIPGAALQMKISRSIR